MFKPDVSRDGMPFDYLEYLTLIDTNYELDIVEKNPNSEAAYGENLATAYGEGFSTENVAQNVPEVKGQFSLSDSEGRQLSNEQAEYFKDSKIKDKDGKLITLYHGTAADFTVFDLARSGENYNGWSEYDGSQN